MRTHKTVSNRFGGRTVINNPACRYRSLEWFKRIFTISSLFFSFLLGSAVFSGKISSYPAAPSVTVSSRSNEPRTKPRPAYPKIARFPTTVLPWGVQRRTDDICRIINGDGGMEGHRNDDQRQCVLRSAPFDFFISHRLYIPVSRGHGRGTWPRAHEAP